MKRNTTWLIAVLLTPLTAHATNPPPVQWMREFSGMGSAGGNWVEQTSDGGYVACGETSDDSMPIATRSKSYVVKTDGNGNLQWERTYGGAPTEVAHSVHQTADRGYAVVGERQARPFLLKTDSMGNVLWERVFQQAPRGFGFTGQPTHDGGYVLMGFSSRHDSAIHLMKTDSLGNILWNGYYSGPKSFFSNVSMQQTQDNGYVFAAGAYLSSGTYRVLWVTKTDSLGNIQWQRTYSAQLVSDGCSIVQTPDGGYVVTGFGSSITDPNDPCAIYLLKVDAAGNPVWKKTYGGDDQDAGYCVATTSDGGYVIAGKLATEDRSDDAYVVRTDSLGNLVWQTNFGSSICADDARCVRQTSDGGYIIVGGGFCIPGNTDHPGSLFLRKLAADYKK